MDKILVYDLIFPNKPLSNRELDRAVAVDKDSPNCRVMFLRDSLPPAPHPVECGILYHDDREDSRMHWTCWYKRE